MEEKGEVNPVPQQPIITVPGWAFILPWWTRGSCLQILPQCWRKGHCLLVPHLRLEDVSPCLLELPALNISRGTAAPLQSSVVLSFLGNSALTATLSETIAHTMYTKGTFSAWSALWSCPLLRIGRPLFPPPLRATPVPWTSTPDAPRIQNPHPQSFRLQHPQLPGSTSFFFLQTDHMTDCLLRLYFMFPFPPARM